MRKGDGTEVNFYRKVEEDDFETAKKKSLVFWMNMLSSSIITEDEYKHMNPMNDRKAARMYMLFNIQGSQSSSRRLRAS